MISYSTAQEPVTGAIVDTTLKASAAARREFAERAAAGTTHIENLKLVVAWKQVQPLFVPELLPQQIYAPMFIDTAIATELPATRNKRLVQAFVEATRGFDELRGVYTSSLDPLRVFAVTAGLSRERRLELRERFIDADAHEWPNDYVGDIEFVDESTFEPSASMTIWT